MPRILDNIELDLGDALRTSLDGASSLDASVGYFNLRGWAELCDAVDALPAGQRPVRLLVGMAHRPDEDLRRRLRGTADRIDNQTALRMKEAALQDFRAQLVVGYPTVRDEQVLERLRHQLSEGRVQIKLFLRHPLHAKLYLAHRDARDNPSTGYVGSSNLTFAGLVKHGELNVDVLDHDATAKLGRWFEDRWGDPFAIDISGEVIELLERSWVRQRDLQPYLIYLRMAYELSKEAREGLLEYGLPEAMQRELLDYQASAVKVATRILERRGGVMIGDVVGLGKTIVATAIARLLQEEQSTEALVICPKNLVGMWEEYFHRYRVLGKVVSLSMAQTQLPELRRYRVVIIDESHNLKNEKGKRYAAIQDYIERNEPKLVLLTATPYNKQFLDVAAQLGLFVHPDLNLGIQPDALAKEIGDEHRFRMRVDGRPQTLGAFRRSEHVEDWRRLMSLFLVRRTRRFIKENYAERDGEKYYLTFANGDRFYFPDRVPRPLPHEVAPGSPEERMTSEATLDAINSLLLPRYALKSYLRDGARPAPAEEDILGDLERAAGNLIGVTRTMLFKRLSSSGAAFVISLERHLLRNWVYLHALRVGDPFPIGHVEDALWEDDDPEQDDLAEDDYLASSRTAEQWAETAGAAYQALAARNPAGVRWIDSGLFAESLEDALLADAAILQGLLAEFGGWSHEGDTKLDALQELVVDTFGGKKVLVFSEYKDTTEYVANALARRGVDGVAAVSGDTDDPTRLARRFSPVSNSALGGLPDGSDEVRVLVATDVLSEGQNLQDAHVVVNYDLPWAIVKIIQRAGRVDRVGQRNDEVFVYSFLPADDVERVIRLRQRIARRLGQNAAVFGGDETFFGDESEAAVIKGLYDEHGHLDDPEEEDVDWVSQAYEVWRKGMDDHPELAKQAENLPLASYATRTANGSAEGVIVHAQTDHGIDTLAITRPDGAAALLSPVEALALAACEADAAAVPRFEEHHELVEQAMTGPLSAPSSHLEGALTGVRKRCWDKMQAHQARTAGTLFDDDALRTALDQLFRRPLRASAQQTLAKALRERTVEELAELIIALHRDDRLCVPSDELDDTGLQLVVSMGLRAV